MSIQDLVALLVSELKDDIVGEILQNGSKITLRFQDGTEREITVK